MILFCEYTLVTRRLDFTLMRPLKILMVDGGRLGGLAT